MISSTGPVGLRDKFKLWEKNIFTEYLCRKYGRKTSQPESQMQIFPGIDHGFQNNEALGQIYIEGDNDFYGIKATNRYFKALFHQEDFVDLTHPHFFHKKPKMKKKRRRSRSPSQVSRASSLSDQDGYKMQRRDSQASIITSRSAHSQITNKTGRSGRYISKKKMKQMQADQEAERARIQQELLQRQRDEEEWRNSKHIQQLQHEADIYEDYNYIVDQLEDEHQRRSVHTTGAIV